MTWILLLKVFGLLIWDFLQALLAEKVVCAPVLIGLLQLWRFFQIMLVILEIGCLLLRKIKGTLKEFEQTRRHCWTASNSPTKEFGVLRLSHSSSLGTNIPNESVDVFSTLKGLYSLQKLIQLLLKDSLSCQAKTSHICRWCVYRKPAETHWQMLKWVQGWNQSLHNILTCQDLFVVTNKERLSEKQGKGTQQILFLRVASGKRDINLWKW